MTDHDNSDRLRTSTYIKLIADGEADLFTDALIRDPFRSPVEKVLYAKLMLITQPELPEETTRSLRKFMSKIRDPLLDEFDTSVIQMEREIGVYFSDIHAKATRVVHRPYFEHELANNVFFVSCKQLAKRFNDTIPEEDTLRRVQVFQNKIDHIMGLWMTNAGFPIQE